ncbi:MAG: hypothetical protein ACFFHV_20975 [Promethearchaeota archaeon]
MGKRLKCAFCGEEVDKKYVTWVEGRPYCEDCVSEAEAMADVDDGWDDDDDDDDYDDDDDD